MTLPANGDLQSTSDEAERLLAELSAHYGHHPSAHVSDDDGILSSAPTINVSAPKQPLPFVLVLIPFGLIIGFVVVLNHMAGSQSSSSLTAAQKALMFRGSCGSISSASGQWWPVLADPDSSLLATVRNRYCGDAYFNTNGRLQVASFNNPQEAEKLAERLSAATGASFYRGKGYKP